MAVLTTTCPFCGVEQALAVLHHRVLRSGNIAVFALCPKCDLPITSVIASIGTSTATAGWFQTGASSASNVDLISASGWAILHTFPQGERKRAPEHTPPDIARIYLQACSTQARGELEASAILFGKTIEVAIKLLDPEAKGTLKERIDRMAREGKISADVVAWATEIRIVRNDAAHQLEEPNPQDVSEVGEFAEAFLMFLFTMPKKIETRLSRKKGSA